jgi:hypothetical protein
MYDINEHDIYKIKYLSNICAYYYDNYLHKNIHF